MNSGTSKKLILITAFSIAMGFLETSVVIYLRMHYYPDGFNFPLAPLDPFVAQVEIAREAATVIMLLSLGAITGKNISEKLAYFIYSFAVWDICYYIFLKWLLNWPESFLTFDILFLIPVMWVGPVIAPIILSGTMILFSGLSIFFNHKTGGKITISKTEWILLIAGSVVILVSFTEDFTYFILTRYSFSELLDLMTSKNIFSLRLQYIPADFDWRVFGFGEILLLIAIKIFHQRNKTLIRKEL